MVIFFSNAVLEDKNICGVGGKTQTGLNTGLLLFIISAIILGNAHH